MRHRRSQSLRLRPRQPLSAFRPFRQSCDTSNRARRHPPNLKPASSRKPCTLPPAAAIISARLVAPTMGGSRLLATSATFRGAALPTGAFAQQQSWRVLPGSSFAFSCPAPAAPARCLLLLPSAPAARKQCALARRQTFFAFVVARSVEARSRLEWSFLSRRLPEAALRFVQVLGLVPRLA
jgi:hypothetical protein